MSGTSSSSASSQVAKRGPVTISSSTSLSVRRANRQRESAGNGSPPGAASGSTPADDPRRRKVQGSRAPDSSYRAPADSVPAGAAGKAPRSRNRRRPSAQIGLETPARPEARDRLSRATATIRSSSLMKRVARRSRPSRGRRSSSSARKSSKRPPRRSPLARIRRRRAASRRTQVGEETRTAGPPRSLGRLHQAARVAIASSSSIEPPGWSRIVDARCQDGVHSPERRAGNEERIGQVAERDLHPHALGLEPARIANQAANPAAPPPVSPAQQAAGPIVPVAPVSRRRHGAGG